MTLNPGVKDSVIYARDVTLAYGRRLLVQHLDLSIRPGEFIGILGQNGSGKSTFLRALLGLLAPAQGQLLVFQQKPFRGNQAIGYMPQVRKYTPPAYLTSRALIEASNRGTRYGLPFISHSEQTQIQSLLRLVKADHYADRAFNTLSGGEKQRIYLAQSLLGNPKLLLLDEPLANLDPKIQKTFIELLSHIQKNLNMTILFTAHDPNPLLGAMDRVLYFAQQKAAIGTVQEIITTDKLSALYGVPVEVVTHHNRLIVIGEGHQLSENGHQHA